MNKTKSVIDMTTVENTYRAFGSDADYIPVFVRKNGNLVPALFTRGQIAVAISRAEKNAEDAPKPTLFQRMFR